MALCQASKESVWMVDFLKNLGVKLRGPMVVNVDNQGSIAPAKNPVLHDHSKHIDILTYSIISCATSSRSRGSTLGIYQPRIC